ncbi:MAG: cytochrome b N-terminal domain-containing protein [Gemmataceae bacterium]
MGKLLDWLDHRTGYRKLRDALLLEHIPGGAKWRYVWGSTLAFVFSIQLVTGILLMTAYVPGDTDAWGSVYYIQYEMDFGWLIRGLHHFGSQTMVVLLGLHMLQVVIAGAHLPPREVNWWLGLALFGLVLALSLTGYLLPWDQKGYYATQVATNIIGNLPLIGPFVQKVLVGGPEYGNATLTHFFSLHVGILPPLLILFVVLHLAAFRRHGVTAPKAALENPERALEPRSTAATVILIVRDLVIALAVGGGAWYLGVPKVSCVLMGGLFVYFAVTRLFDKPEAMGHFWPDQAFRDLVVCLWIFAIMLSLVVFSEHGHKLETAVPAEEPGLYEYWAKAGQRGLGANLDAPADRMTEEYPARPEWYFLSLFQLLKYFKGDQEIIGTVIIPAGLGLALFLLPLLGYGRMRPFGHILGVLVVLGMLIGAAALTFLAIADDSPDPLIGGLGGSENAKKFRERLKGAEEEARLAVQAAAHGIPAEGARFLVRSNPLIAGKKLFKLHCAACHAYDFKEPGEATDKKAGKKSEAKASDLTGYATEAWIRGLLENPKDPKYFGHTPRLKEMVEWREGVDEGREAMNAAQKKEQDQSFDDIAWFLASQALDPDARKEKLKADTAFAARWEKGMAAYKENCKTCHNIDDVVAGGRKGPDFTGYGSQDWIHTMILAPTHRSRYPDRGKTVRNTMPAFRPAADTPAGKFRLDEFSELYPDFPKDKVIALTDYERELIVRFLMRDERVVFGALPVAGPPPAKK